MSNALWAVVYRLAIAQIASDAGKGIFRHELIALVDPEDARRAIRARYNLKDRLLVAQIGYLTRHHVAGVDYHINSDDAHGCNGTIVYFNLRCEGKRYQVSFHSPHNEGFRKIADISRTSWICSTISGKRRKEVMDSAETLVYLLTNVKKESE